MNAPRKSDYRSEAYTTLLGSGSAGSGLRDLAEQALSLLSLWLGGSRGICASTAEVDGRDAPYRLYTSRKRSAAAVAQTVMARLVPTGCTHVMSHPEGGLAVPGKFPGLAK